MRLDLPTKQASTPPFTDDGIRSQSFHWAVKRVHNSVLDFAIDFHKCQCFAVLEAVSDTASVRTPASCPDQVTSLAKCASNRYSCPTWHHCRLRPPVLLSRTSDSEKSEEFLVKKS
ncbi:hypothetical protein Bbelb_333210 [Branchiostoma belcheri]|nr:hypothetical protein Bbelb_333210 [Branchiostoma belcheri]